MLLYTTCVLRLQYQAHAALSVPVATRQAVRLTS